MDNFLRDAKKAGTAMRAFFDSPGGNITRTVANFVPFGGPLLKSLEEAGRAMSNIQINDGTENPARSANPHVAIHDELLQILKELGNHLSHVENSSGSAKIDREDGEAMMRILRTALAYVKQHMKC